jgi:phage baseplate assembly protein W
MLFEPITPMTALMLQRRVQEVLVNFEPRIRLVQITANPNIDSNAYDLRIYFYVVGSDELIEVQSFLERLR